MRVAPADRRAARSRGRALVGAVALVAMLLAVGPEPERAHAGGSTRGGSPTPVVRADVPPEPVEHVIWLWHAGLRRRALVRVPAAGWVGPRPALFHFPGMFETPEIAERSARLTSYAEQAGYLLVIPEHEGVGWQGVAGGTPGPSVDDPGFVRALAGHVVAAFGADPSRLYASGMSNGGLFTQVLACQAADLFAAFAAVAGSAPGAGCAAHSPDRPTGGGSPARPVPMLVVHGREDRIIRYDQAEAAARDWARAAGCVGPPVAVALPDVDPADGTTVVRHDFAGCPGTPVVLYEVVGGGHSWPGGLPPFSAAALGRTSRDLDTNRVIWDFVSGFRLRR